MTTLTDATNSVSTYIVENQVGGITAAILNTVLTTTINAVSGAVAQVESGFQGALATDPTGDLGGNPLTASAWYYNTTTNQVKAYIAGAWTAVIQATNTRIVTLSTSLNILTTDFRVGLLRTTSLSAMSAQLPLGTMQGQEFVIQDLAGNFNAYPVTLLPPAGMTFSNSRSTYVLNEDNQTVRVAYYGSNVFGVETS